MNINEVTKDGAALSPVKGLYDAQVGDILEIGIEGQRPKIHSKVAKRHPDGKIVDSKGNIFYPSGQVYRRKSYEIGHSKGKKVFARIVTQKQLDKEMHERKIDFLERYNWKDLPEEKLNRILGIIRVSFGSMQGQKEFKEE